MTLKDKFNIMTLNDYAYEVLELVQRQTSDDIEIDIRLIKDLIVDQRMLDFNKSIFSKKGILPYSKLSKYAQSIDVPFIKLSETLDIDYCKSDDYNWLRSDNTEPFKFADYLGTPAVLYVTVTDSSISKFIDKINFVTSDRALYIGNGRFNSNQKLCFYSNGKIIIVTKDSEFVDQYDREIFSIFGILEDPRDADGFEDDSSIFPMGPNWAYMQAYIVDKLVKKLQMPEDIVNDGVDEFRTNKK